MKIFLSIDFDYWNTSIDGYESLRELLYYVGNLQVGKIVVDSHENIISFAKSIDWDLLVNIDEHSDLKGYCLDEVRACEIDCGNWVDFVAKEDCRYIWAMPRFTHEEYGRCDSDYYSDYRFQELNKIYKTVNHVYGWEKIVYGNDIVGVGIAFSFFQQQYTDNNVMNHIFLEYRIMNFLKKHATTYPLKDILEYAKSHNSYDSNR